MALVHAPAHEAERAIPARVVERVLSKVTETEDGCLLSTYSPVSKWGYRQVSWAEGGREHKMLVHRVAWIAEHGSIPPKMTVHHKCFNTACVNVEHMTIMDVVDNVRRKGGDDWEELGVCKRGHPDSEMVWESRQRVCYPCRRLRRHERKLEKLAESSAGAKPQC